MIKNRFNDSSSACIIEKNAELKNLVALSSCNSVVDLDSVASNKGFFKSGLEYIVFFIAKIRYHSLYTRKECLLTLFLVTIVILAFFFVNNITIKQQIHETLKYHPNYNALKSVIHLNIGTIDHWCFDGGDDHCVYCENPSIPSSRGEKAGWAKAHHINKKMIDLLLDSEDVIDVVFLGDGLIEAQSGRNYGLVDPSLHGIKSSFDESILNYYNAIPLGIHGDTSTNLLWRCIHGNIPNALNPRVWWISIGWNDLRKTQCSEEVTIMGILRVVEEVRLRKPDAIIVITSIIPLRKKYLSSIININKNLEKIAEQRMNIIFFDIIKIFTKDHHGKMSIIKDMFRKDRSRLSLKGYQMFHQTQLVQLQKILRVHPLIQDDQTFI